MPKARCRRIVGVVPKPIALSALTGYSTRTRLSRCSGSSLGIWYVARYAYICSTHIPTSRARERGNTASAKGVEAAAAITTGGLRRSRRRSNGAAMPAASTVQAAARMAVERGTDVANIAASADVPGTGSRPVRLGRARVAAAQSGALPLTARRFGQTA